VLLNGQQHWWALHSVVPFSWPQLFGTTHLHVAMHSPGACVPLGSSAHWPVVVLQLYITAGVGAGVGGTGVGGTGVGGTGVGGTGVGFGVGFGVG
jgi:hypothetical protein